MNPFLDYDYFNERQNKLRFRKGYRTLEPDDGKLSRPVLRREKERNLPDLSDDLL